MQKCLCGHYTGNKYDLTQATHRYNNITQVQQVMRVVPTAQNIVLLATNIQVQHQANVVIDPTTVASLEYSHIIKGTTKSIWENSFGN